MAHLGDMTDEISGETKLLGLKVALGKSIDTTYNRTSGYVFTRLCENCGRDTNGSPFCRYYIEPGYYKSYPGNNKHSRNPSLLL